MLAFGFNSKAKPVVPAGTYSLTVGQDLTEFGYNDNVGSLVPLGLAGFEVAGFISTGADTLVLRLGDGNDLIPGYIYVRAELPELGLTLILSETDTVNSYSVTYTGIRNLIGVKNNQSTSLIFTPLPAENALYDSYEAFLVDENNNALIH